LLQPQPRFSWQKPLADNEKIFLFFRNYKKALFLAPGLVIIDVLCKIVQKVHEHHECSVKFSNV